MRLVLILVAAVVLHAHAPVTPEVRAPLTTRGNRILDASGEPVLLRGFTLPSIDAATPATLGVIRVRANMNTVRIPVLLTTSPEVIEAAVTRANRAGLLAVVALDQPGALPDAGTTAFWSAAATRLKGNPRVAFSIFRRPVLASRDWTQWRAAMQRVVDTIRAAGAAQLISVAVFHDAQGFLDFDQELNGGNVVYEIHPSFEFGSFDALVGEPSARLPVYVGEWGIDLRTDSPGCRSLPSEPQRLADLLYETLLAFDRRSVSWTASTFAPGGLIRDASAYLPTSLDRPWTCGVPSDPQPGMGEILLTLSTGDPAGFGSLREGLIANAAGGPASPLAPGQLLTIYTEQLGPDPSVAGSFDASGELPRVLGGTRVLIGGRPAPLVSAGAFGITIQTPYEVEPGRRVPVQVIAGDVPSNTVEIEVVPVAVELFHDPSSLYAIAFNQDSTRNGPQNPARPGSIVVLFGSGGGQTVPAGVTGRGAPRLHPRLVNRLEVEVDSRAAEILFAGETPGFVGLAQINVRLPLFDVSVPRATPIVVRSGGWRSRSPVLLWVDGSN